LETVKATALLKLRESEKGDIVVTCSALKRSDRDELRKSRVMETAFFLLESEERVLKERLEKREGNFVGKGMVESQLELMEVPGVEEGDVVPVDAGRESGVVLEEVMEILGGL
jgi:carbohydrate kinase (thermoresistant glucokinase family)